MSIALNKLEQLKYRSVTEDLSYMRWFEREDSIDFLLFAP